MEFIKPKLPPHEFPSGVYKITFNDKWIYIGSTHNLKKRFVRWKTSITKPHFLSSKMVRNVLTETVKVEIEILQICTDYFNQEQIIINQLNGNPWLLNKRKSETVYGKIAQFDLNNTLINVFSTMKDAVTHTGFKNWQIIGDLNGKRISVNGFRFKLVDADGSFIEHNIVKERYTTSDKIKKEAIRLRKKGHTLKYVSFKLKVPVSAVFAATKNISFRNKLWERQIKVVSSHGKPVIMFDLYGKMVKRFKTLLMAASYIGSSSSSIARQINGKNKSKKHHKGYTFMYADEYHKNFG